MGKVIFSLLIAILVSLKPCVSIPTWDLPKSSVKNSNEIGSNNNSNLSGKESMYFNSQKFHDQLNKQAAIKLNNDSTDNLSKKEAGIYMEADSKIISNEYDPNVTSENEKKYILLIIYIFAILAIVLFTHFIYLRKYKKLVAYLREMRKENKELKAIHTNLKYLNTQLENQSESKIQELKDLHNGNETIRNQHKKMLSYNFHLERIIEERNKQIADLNMQLSMKNRKLEKFIYIISRKTIRPIASLKGLTYLIETSIYTQENIEISGRLKACVAEVEELLQQLNNMGEIEKEDEELLKKVI